MQKALYEAICFGEILWDVLPSGAKPGGAPMNVAYHLQKLGIPTAMISRVGKDERGEQLLQLLQNNSIDVDFIQKDEQHSTGIVNATIRPNNEVLYDIVYPVAWDFIEWKQELSDMVEKARFFVYGSLAARNKTSCQTLLKLREAAHTKVVDINLRPPHFNQKLIEDMLKGADIVKLNEHELFLISRWYKELKEMDEQVKFLQDKFFIPIVIVTKGGEGAMVCKEGNVLTHKGFPVKVADTVGSGDAFLAAFLSGIFKEGDMEGCLQYANALGAFIASKEGACPAYQLEEVSRIMLATPAV